MNTIQIEYCYDCMFLGRAVEIASLVLGKHAAKIASLDLKPGEDGIFTIAINDSEVYVIGEYGIPLSADEGLSIIEENMKTESMGG